MSRNRFRPVDLKQIKTRPIESRSCKVSVDHFAKPPRAGSTVEDWLDELPDLLAAADLRQIVDRWVDVVQTGRTVILAMGAHPIKCGLNPVIVALMEAGAISALAMNGAGSIHDLEVALTGSTSEDVAQTLHSGNFGTAWETGHFLHQALSEGLEQNVGFGEALGRFITAHEAEHFPNADKSLLAAAARLDVQVTVHVAIGTDTVHYHPEMSGAVTGEMTHRDFLRFAGAVRTLADGLYINLGSAVLLPEVFLKAVSVCANLDGQGPGFTTVDMDMIAHYRATENVIKRPPGQTGQGFRLIGHHEILLPLIARCLLDRLKP